MKRADEDAAKRAEQAKEGVVYYAPWAAHALPHLHYGKAKPAATSESRVPNLDARNVPGSGSGDAIQSAFYALLHTVGVPDPKQGMGTGKDTESLVVSRKPDNRMNYGGSVYIVFKPNQAKALRDLWLSIEANNEAAYVEGFAKGNNLLLGLAGGDLTAKEFNERALRETNG